MKLTKAQQQIVLVVLIALIVLINGYYYLNGEKPKTAPLTYTRGAIAVSPARQGPLSRMATADPLNVFLERRREKFPEVVRYIFQMENPAPKPKVPVKPVAPPVHVKTPEEIAAEAAQAAADAAKAAVEVAAQAARTDLMKFQLLGYLTDKDSTLFLSKEGELFVVKKGSKLLKSYKVKEANKNYVILLDTITGVEVQLELPGGEISPQHESQQQPPLVQKKRQRVLGPVPGQ
jgi:hypothetical protein